MKTRACVLKAFDFVGERRPTIQKKVTTFLLTVKNVMDKLTLNARYNANDSK